MANKDKTTKENYQELVKIINELRDKNYKLVTDNAQLIKQLNDTLYKLTEAKQANEAILKGMYIMSTQIKSQNKKLLDAKLLVLDSDGRGFISIEKNDEVSIAK